MANRYALVVRQGDDTVHREHPYEACNTDDADDVQTIDELTAIRMLAAGTAKACRHCDPMVVGQ